MGDDREFIDLDSTQNWSQLDVKRELDNLEYDEKTGKKMNFARGFSEDLKDKEDKIILDGLTSGLNYIPEEFLMAADEKKEAEMEAKPAEEKPDVSWAYREDGEDEESNDEPFVPIVELKKAEEEAAKLRAQEVAATKAKEAEIEAIRAKNLEEQAKRLAEANASDEIVKANIEARKQAREAVAAENEAKIRANAEARKEAQKQAEIDMYINNNDDAFSNQMLDLDDLDVPVVSKEERIAAANKNRHNVTEEIKLDGADAEQVIEYEPIFKKASSKKEKVTPKKEEAAKVSADTDIIDISNTADFKNMIGEDLPEINYALDEREKSQSQKELSTGDTGVIYIDEDDETAPKHHINVTRNSGKEDEAEEKQPSVAVTDVATSVVTATTASAAMAANASTKANTAGAKTTAAGADETVAKPSGSYEEMEYVETEEADTETDSTDDASTDEGMFAKVGAVSDEYAAWADASDDELVPVKKKKKKKKKKKPVNRKKEKEIIEDDEDDLIYGGFWDRVVAFFKNMSGLDFLVMSTGILVVLVAIITIAVYSSSRATQAKIDEFSGLGEKMQAIGVSGSSKLVAVADAKRALAEMDFEEEEIVEEEPVEYNEKEEDKSISVTMTLTSVKKDLKIKFINAKTKKLVGNYEFKVDIEDVKGKKYSATDDDRDGIIYLNSVEPGKAKVAMQAMDEKDLTFSTETVTVTIKENIDYKKIDVADEVKKESEINAAKEDTAAGLATEGSLKDTVEWVESTSTDIDGGYVKTNGKSDIIDPANQLLTPAAKKQAKTIGVTNSVIRDTYYASEMKWLVAAANDGASNDGSGENTPSPTEEPTPTSAEEPTPSPTEEPTPTPTPELTPTPAQEPTPTPTAVPSPTVIPSPSASPSVAVSPSPTVDPKQDTTTLLKNKNGEQMYVKEADGTFREAKFADYYKYDTFYRKAKENENKKYTGWQEINGNTYFFDKNGNYVTGEQVIQGAKYNFDSTGALVKGSGSLGIDVSKWNANINWTAVKNSGVSFVIIRCGYRGSSSGALVEDPKFKTNIKGATDAGLKVGVYFFSQAVTDVEAVEEASMAINLMKGYKVSYPVFLDVEDSGGRGDKIDANTRTQVIKAFCETVKNSGYTPGVYANKSWLETKMNVGSLSNYKIWLAQYNTAPTYKGRYDLWQYSSKGSVGGIGGNTDMNLSYLGY